ncbi:class I SAM-dependent methyltransferase [Paraconexibacter algicola]|uniref:Class I SAM-dependent methyltransferase n=1 Tax=Paraconexibacter algicola TaxID=2133960 RepID=A0A2T4UHC7_9ACTN|nr:class I SAM-dependent methyltransferase [Paraconexibacter algicola]PTL58653.1 hypothetical protein C7Y72_02795 [Paraconexibacter algicola]
MTVCPACGARVAPWRDVPSGEPGVAPLPVGRCAACGTGVTLAAPAAQEDFHESGAYAPVAPRGAALAAPLLARFDRQRLRLLARACPAPARVVDAGAGRGRFVAAARAAGYDATGVEPTARGVDMAASRYGVALVRAAIEDAPVPAASVDAVSLWHVLEHVDDPAATLRTLRSWLRPGGVLLLGVPNLASWQARIGGDRWWHLDLPRHRTHFTTTGLRALLRREGFTVEHEQHLLLEHNPFGLWQSAVSRVTPTPSWLYYALKRVAPLRAADALPTVAAMPLLPVAAGVEAAAGLARRGGTVAVLART